MPVHVARPRSACAAFVRLLAPQHLPAADLCPAQPEPRAKCLRSGTATGPADSRHLIACPRRCRRCASVDAAGARGALPRPARAPSPRRFAGRGTRAAPLPPRRAFVVAPASAAAPRARPPPRSSPRRGRRPAPPASRSPPRAVRPSPPPSLRSVSPAPLRLLLSLPLSRSPPALTCSPPPPPNSHAAPSSHVARVPRFRRASLPDLPPAVAPPVSSPRPPPRPPPAPSSGLLPSRSSRSAPARLPPPVIPRVAIVLLARGAPPRLLLLLPFRAIRR